MSISTRVTIRPFDPQDQAAARELILSGLGDHFGRADPSRVPDLDDIMATYIKAGHVVVVAAEHNTIVGTGILVSEDRQVGRLVRMSVSRQHRRKGIGSALVNHLLDVARKLGMTKVVIETNNDWVDAIGLYHRCGFAEDGRDDINIFMSRQL